MRSCDVEAISGSLKRFDIILADLSPLPVQISLSSLLILLFLSSRLRPTQRILRLEGTWGILYFYDVGFQAQSFSQRWECRVGGRNANLRSDSHCFPVPACLCPVLLSLLLCVAWPSIMVSCRFSKGLLWLLRMPHFHSPWNPLAPFSLDFPGTYSLYDVWSLEGNLITHSWQGWGQPSQTTAKRMQKCTARDQMCITV